MTDQPLTAAQLRDGFQLMVIRSLLSKIEDEAPCLVADALADCVERIRQEGWTIDRDARQQSSQVTRRVSAMTGCDAELTRELFLPTRADLVADELKQFIQRRGVGKGTTRKASRA